MKRAKQLRTLEELWDLEDRYPLVDSSPAGLLRWMFATASVGRRSSPDPKRSRSKKAPKD